MARESLFLLFADAILVVYVLFVGFVVFGFVYSALVTKPALLASVGMVFRGIVYRLWQSGYGKLVCGSFRSINALILALKVTAVNS
ncbi:MAG: hypothetical protein RQ732_08610 [Methylophaga sp.]|nr:hypothetical protein [Methylophaga sp.]